MEQLDILIELDRICKKHNIKYFLAYGTAIGAARHKGFIPWDDDIDVSMTMDNYNKFTKIAPNELRDSIFFQTLETDKYTHLYWNKLRKKNTFCKSSSEERLKMNLGICIDIFPLAKYPKSEKLQRIFWKKLKIGTIILETKLYKAKQKKVNLKGKILYSFLSLIPLKILNRIAKNNFNKVLNYDGDYDYYVEYSEFYNRIDLFPKKMIEENLINIEFEGKKFLMLKDYDGYLKIRYGDYMKLPPKSERQNHGELTIKFSDGEEI